ncbi:MAG: glycosyltransferase [Spirochaetes bacterium]|nr:glycosyltransferase [Spirochaetota bacterium]
MITIIVFISNRVDFESYLLPGLKQQRAGYQLITIDSNDKRYRSRSEAFNSCFDSAKGKYLLFTNEKLSFAGETWLEDLEHTLDGLDNLGAAGVVGLSISGMSWKKRLCFTRDVYSEWPFDVLQPAETAQKVQTLDDNFIVIPRELFGKYKFDDKIFDGDFLFAADYCLTVSKHGFHSYYVPLSCRIYSSPFDDKIWKFNQVYKYKKNLFVKHRDYFKRIYTYLGAVSFLRVLFFPIILYPYSLSFFFQLSFISKRWDTNADQNDSLLNLGCGFYFPDIKDKLSYSVGVELYEPALQKSKLLKIHNQYIQGDIRNIQFKPKSFDIVTAIEVLEHLTKEEGGILLNNMESWARKRVIITTPNGYLNQDELDMNPYQIHNSGWKIGDFKKLGYKTKGLGGHIFSLAWTAAFWL